MSTKMKPTAPSNATMAAAVVSDEMIKKAWAIDLGVETYIYMALGAAYCASYIPSAYGLVIMGPSRAALSWYLIYDAIMRFLDIDKKPKSESGIWNITNWALYSLRRAIVENYILGLNVGTTSIPILSFVLNLIPYALSYVNLFVL